jgi:hypothetical protein
MPGQAFDDLPESRIGGAVEGMNDGLGDGGFADVAHDGLSI